MTAMTAIASMPGHWPRDLGDEAGSATAIDPRALTRQLAEEASVPANGITLYDPPQGSRDELFFDCRTSPRPTTAENDAEDSPRSYLTMEPVVAETSDVQEPDWRRYDPPRELRNFQDSPPVEIQGLLVPSIELIQARHAEELSRLAAEARPERPLARAGRASVRPHRDVSMSGALSPSTPARHLRLSVVSDLSTSSNDSGYGSQSTQAESSKSRSPVAGTRKSFALSSIFRWKDRTAGNPKELDDNDIAQPTATRETVPLPVAEPATGECVSCLDDFATGTLVKLSCHNYCPDCFQKLISTALESETHWPAKCCLTAIPSTKILPHLNSKLKQKYQQRAAEWSIPVGDRIFCAKAGCNMWIPPKFVNLQRRIAKCPGCNNRTCTTCRGQHHNLGDCPQDANLLATINLAELEGWKRCYSCHALVEHNQGCRHMTCRCKAQFCYICGLRWRTCACTDAQLVMIQQRAGNLRQTEAVRGARAAAEAEEERVALRMVADFVRLEGERLSREAEAERRRQEAARRRREEEHIAAVNFRFRRLGLELEVMHDVQRIQMAERYDQEAEVLKRSHQDALDVFSVRHPSEAHLLVLESRVKISDAEYKYDQEYQGRFAEERRIEEDYVTKLREYWKGKPEAEHKIRTARDKLRSDQDREYKFWDCYRRNQLKALDEGERRKMEAVRVKHVSEIRAEDRRWKNNEAEWKRKIWAEGHWMEEVARERISMLDSMEQEEYARGG